MTNGEMNNEQVQNLNEETNEEYITIKQSEYQLLQYWAAWGQGRKSFWREAIQNPEGSKIFFGNIKEILESLITKWTEAHKGGLLYSGIRIIAVLVIIALIVWVTFQLTILGKLDSSAMVFLLGTIVGYLLSFITKVELMESS